MRQLGDVLLCDVFCPFFSWEEEGNEPKCGSAATAKNGKLIIGDEQNVGFVSFAFTLFTAE